MCISSDGLYLWGRFQPPCRPALLPLREASTSDVVPWLVADRWRTLAPTSPEVILSPVYWPVTLAPVWFNSMRRYAVVPNRSADINQLPLTSTVSVWPTSNPGAAALIRNKRATRFRYLIVWLLDDRFD